MPQPTAYTPVADFSADEVANAGGRSTVNTAALDAETAAIATTLSGVLTNLALNQRDDGEIRDERVKMHTLAADVKALLVAGGATIKGAWTTSTAYIPKDVVTQSGNTYICAVAHTSGTFATDLAAVKWVLLSLASAVTAAGMPFTPTATIAATTVQGAIEEADTEIRAAVAQLITDMASTALSKGISLSGVRDAGGYFSGADGESVLQEIGAKNAAQDVSIAGNASSIAALSTTLASSMGAATALMSGRTAPNANFSWFTSLWAVIGCPGPGRAALQQDIYDVFLAQHGASMTGGIVYVDGTNGSDGNAGTITAPWATLDKALRTSNSGLIYVMPGTYTSTGFRYNDTQGDRPKALIAPGGGVKITPGGDTLSAATWTANGTYGSVYQTVLVSSNYVTRVLDSTVVDELGLPVPLPKCASLAAVNTAGWGWYYDSGTKTLYVRLGALNVNTVKARLSAIYAPSGDNQFLINSAVLYMENITLDGYLYVLNTAGQATPKAWLKNCTVRYAESNSRNVQGGYCYSQGCTYYRSAADHANYNTLNGIVARGAEIDDATWYAGDADSFGSGATQPNNPVSTGQNKNGSSNHDGYVVRVNGRHLKAYGPPIADTAGSYTWCMGTVTGYSYATAGGGQRYGFIMQGNAAWLDGCQGSGGLDAAFNADSSAAVKTFNCLGTQVASSGGTFATYTPT